MKIDLNSCRKGDILISRQGVRMFYESKLNSEIDYYDHKVKYEGENVGFGTRTNDGFVMRNEGSRIETDRDIVEIIYM